MRSDDRREQLAQATDLLNEVRWGQTAYLDRISEMTGHYPGGSGQGGGGRGSYSDPTLGATGKRDPGREELADYDSALTEVYRAVRELHRLWSRVQAPVEPPDKVSDPGCQPCSKVPEAQARVARRMKVEPGEPLVHWCPTYCHVDVAGPKGKTRVRVCQPHYSLFRRLSRLPTDEELLAHVEGRRVRVSA